MANVCDTFQGYPTRFDTAIKNWEQLSPGLSIIELLTPPVINLKDPDGNCYLTIPLKDGFKYVMQNKTAVLLTASNDNTSVPYGFGFVDEGTRQGFEAALFKLSQYYLQLPLNTPIPTPSLEQNIVDGKKPVVRKRLTNEMLANKDPDQVNEFIAQHGNKDHEEESLCVTLSQAIEAGDIKKAQDIVMQLARQKAKLNAIPIPPIPKESKVDITIQVESKCDYETPTIKLSVDPLVMTVRDLKNEIYRKYSFPRSIQKLIIKKRLAEDNEILVKCGVDETDIIYLYLKAVDDTEFKSNSKEVQTVPVSPPKLQPQSNIKQKNQHVQLQGNIYEYGNQALHQQKSVPYDQGFQTQQHFPRGSAPYMADLIQRQFQSAQPLPNANQGYLPRQPRQFLAKTGGAPEANIVHGDQSIDGATEYPEVYEAYPINEVNLKASRIFHDYQSVPYK